MGTFEFEKRTSNAERLLVSNAVMNYITDKVTLSKESWNFKGVEISDFSVQELLRIIYYISPKTFNEIKRCAEEKELNNGDTI